MGVSADIAKSAGGLYTREGGYGFFDGHQRAGCLNRQDPLTDMAGIKTKFDRIRTITGKLRRITRYRTRTYIEGQVIIDIDRASQEP